MTTARDKYLSKTKLALDCAYKGWTKRDPEVARLNRHIVPVAENLYDELYTKHDDVMYEGRSQ